MAVGGIGLDRGMYDSNRDGRAAAADNIALLMERFNRGEFDLVAVGRSLLNDPEWTRKLRRGEAQLPFDQSQARDTVLNAAELAALTDEKLLTRRRRARRVDPHVQRARRQERDRYARTARLLTVLHDAGRDPGVRVRRA